MREGGGRGRFTGSRASWTFALGEFRQRFRSPGRRLEALHGWLPGRWSKGEDEGR